MLCAAHANSCDAELVTIMHRPVAEVQRLYKLDECMSCANGCSPIQHCSALFSTVPEILFCRAQATIYHQQARRDFWHAQKCISTILQLCC